MKDGTASRPRQAGFPRDQFLSRTFGFHILVSLELEGSLRLSEVRWGWNFRFGRRKQDPLSPLYLRLPSTIPIGKGCRRECILIATRHTHTVREGSRGILLVDRRVPGVDHDLTNGLRSFRPLRRVQTFLYSFEYVQRRRFSAVRKQQSVSASETFAAQEEESQDRLRSPRSFVSPDSCASARCCNRSLIAARSLFSDINHHLFASLVRIC